MFFILVTNTPTLPPSDFLSPVKKSMHENDCFFLVLKVKETVVMHCYDHISNAVESRFMAIDYDCAYLFKKIAFPIPDIGLSQKN